MTTKPRDERIPQARLGSAGQGTRRRRRRAQRRALLARKLTIAREQPTVSDWLGIKRSAISPASQQQIDAAIAWFKEAWTQQQKEI